MMWVKTGGSFLIVIVICLFFYSCSEPDEEEKNKELKKALHTITSISIIGIAVSAILGIWGV